jgi:lipopolysaccharide transport system ATP-binding protein
MSDIAIRVENLGKAYRITRQQQGHRYKTLQEEILGLPKRVWDLARGQGDGRETVWALKDVSFEVKQGEVLGIIGRNGAGKSTLLKVLSRITEPSEGHAEVYGRVGSLLEVGTGFHPELTGRENVFLNGAILGMTRQEVKRKFDEIVDFAGVEQYIDTPVKRYSSGMQVRLAFSVAAHLEPEILLVDEVLAVGDAQFQKKSLGKMGEVTKEGRTVLFVSHNMAAIREMCKNGMWISDGGVVGYGKVEDVVAHYLDDLSVLAESTPLADRTDREGTQWLVFTDVGIYDSQGRTIEHVFTGQDVVFRLFYRSNREIEHALVDVAMHVKTSKGDMLTNPNSQDAGDWALRIWRHGFFECHWPRFQLRSGTYSVSVAVGVDQELVDRVHDAFRIHVEDGDYYGSGFLRGRAYGDIVVDNSWTSHSISCTADQRRADSSLQERRDNSVYLAQEEGNGSSATSGDRRVPG